MALRLLHIGFLLAAVSIAAPPVLGVELVYFTTPAVPTAPAWISSWRRSPPTTPSSR